MNRRRSRSSAHLDRCAYASATPARRAKLTAEWLDRGEPSAPDAEYVRRVRERDLGDARALFGPYLALASILGAVTIASINWMITLEGAARVTMLFVALAAITAMGIGIAGSSLAFHRMTVTSRELARLDARAVREA